MISRQGLVLGVGLIGHKAFSDVVPPVANPPVNTIIPVISPSSNVYASTLLTCSTGTWTNTPLSYLYEWFADGSPVGTNANTYTPTGQAGKLIMCRVTATNADGSNNAFSASVGVISPPFNTALPVITGTITVGQTLSVSNGTWANNPSFAYQWKRDGANISGAASSTYVLQAADAWTSITCTVTGTNPSGNSAATSAAVGPINDLLGTPFAPTPRVGNNINILACNPFDPLARSSVFVFHVTRSASAALDVNLVNNSGLTMNLIGTILYDIGSGIRLRVKIWQVPIPSTPPTGVTFTVTAGVTARHVMNFISVPNAGIVPIASDVAMITNTVGDPAPVLDHTPAVSSVVLGAFHGGSLSDLSITPPTNLIELEDLWDTNSQLLTETAYKVGSAAATYAWSSALTVSIGSLIDVRQP